MLTITYFTSSTCAPCKALLPKVKALVAENADLKLTVVSIDEDAGASIAMRAGVMHVPTLLFTRPGEPTNDETTRILSTQARMTEIKKLIEELRD